MNGKYPLTGVLNPDTRKWYETERCWNCEPEDLRKMRIGKSKTGKGWLTRR